MADLTRDVIQILRGTAAQIAAITLRPGEIAYATDTHALYIGTVTGNKKITFFDLDQYGSPQNGVYRIRHSFNNFLGNAGFESWSAGANTYPDNWFNAGGNVAVARVSNPTQGAYSCEITLNPGGSGYAYSGMANSWGAMGAYVSYTGSLYYRKISGSGSAALICMENGDDWTEFCAAELNNSIDGNWKLAACSYTVPVDHDGAGTMFKITARDANESVWEIDEAMLQESKDLATAWLYAFIDDSTNDQRIFGRKVFYAMPTFPSIPQFASNPAAITGGLVAGDFYRDGSGFVRVVYNP